MKVFEYGGGGSTLFFLSRMQINTVITAEHDGTWFHELEKTIRNLGLSGWKGMYLPPENSASVADPSDPSGYISNHPDFRGMEFGKYARSIDAFDNNFFDLVLIDGRARPSCLFHAISKVKSGGLLILDNSEREYYTKNSQGRINTLFTVEMDGFAPVPYNDWFSKTTIWKKK
ncbi:MAG: hypothetical protein IT242_08390 [Bacteroidia bacterium]|nr:hypothetical protein [Bacteroidia bacterium]